MATLIRNRQIVLQPSPPDAVLAPADDPATLADRVQDLRVIAVQFPKWGDGRGYSIGRLLRERYGFKGELRAVGEIARDHLQALERVGFDAFELREGEDPVAALGGFHDFSTAYQKGLHA